MPVLLAASVTYLDDKKAILEHWSDINAAEYHTTISEDLTVLCLPGVKKKHKWIDADGVVSLWWLGRNSDSDDVRWRLVLSIGANTYRLITGPSKITSPLGAAQEICEPHGGVRGTSDSVALYDVC